MSEINNILTYAARLYQVKEPKVYSIEAQSLMATMHTHLVRFINLLESSTEKLPKDGLSNFDHLNTLPGAICPDELHDYEAHDDVPILRYNEGKTRRKPQPHAATAKATHQAPAIEHQHYSGRLF